MVTSISIAKEDIEDMEWLKEYCKDRGLSKSWLIMKLVSEWVEKEKKSCITSTQ